MFLFSLIELASSSIFKIFDPEWIAQFIQNISPWQYIFLFSIIFMESGILLGIFLPGDTLLFVSGILAVNGDLNIWILVPLFFLAAFLGDQAGYFIGKYSGDHYFQNDDARFLKKSHVEKTHAFYEKHGPKTILLARFVPIVRTLAPVMAGTGKMEYKTFVTFNAIGALIWGVGITLAGYFLGKSIGADKVDKYLLPIVILIFIASMIPPFIEWCKAKKHKKQATSVS